jgi:hypothetical protein
MFVVQREEIYERVKAGGGPASAEQIRADSVKTSRVSNIAKSVHVTTMP